jgi:hypothetical protein
LEGHFQVPDPDFLARLAEQDIDEAVATLRNELRPDPAIDSRWTERLAQTLRIEKHVRLDEWAESDGLTPETSQNSAHIKWVQANLWLDGHTELEFQIHDDAALSFGFKSSTISCVRCSARRDGHMGGICG